MFVPTTGCFLRLYKKARDACLCLLFSRSQRHRRAVTQPRSSLFQRPNKGRALRRAINPTRCWEFKQSAILGREGSSAPARARVTPKGKGGEPAAHLCGLSSKPHVHNREELAGAFIPGAGKEPTVFLCSAVCQPQTSHPLSPPPPTPPALVFLAFSSCERVSCAVTPAEAVLSALTPQGPR